MTIAGSEVGVRESNALRYRLATSIVGLPIVLGAVWLGGPFLMLVTVGAGVVAAIEVRRLLPGSGRLALVVAVTLATSLVVVAFAGWPMWPHLVVGLSAVGLLVLRLRRGRENAASLNAKAASILGPLYPAALLSFGLATHALALEPDGLGSDEFGRNWLLFTLLLVFASDTSAYVVGRVVGIHRLAPRISPGKTWEGALGAVIGTSVISVVLWTVLPLHADQMLGLEVLAAVALFSAVGVGISILAQAGDLFESALKRSAGARESGGLLPGHGGFLDRLDSILPVLPAVYIGLLWVS